MGNCVVGSVKDFVIHDVILSIPPPDPINGTITIIDNIIINPQMIVFDAVLSDFFSASFSLSSLLLGRNAVGYFLMQ